MAQAESGLLPAPSYGPVGILRGSLSGCADHFRAGRGTLVLPEMAQVAESAERTGGLVSWMTLQANGCRAFGGSLAACGGVEMGDLRGQGEGVSYETAGRSLWVAGTLAVLGRLSFSDAFSGEARWGPLSLLRPDSYLEPYGSLHWPSWVSGRLSLGIGFR